MPYFALTHLSPNFLQAFADEAFLEKLEKGTSVYRVRVLRTRTHVKSFFFLAKVFGKNHKIVSPDWQTTMAGHAISGELLLDQLQRICIYDPVDSFYHPTPVNHSNTDLYGEQTGIVGWSDLGSHFEIKGVSDTGNVLLFATDGSSCMSLSADGSHLPSPE